MTEQKAPPANSPSTRQQGAEASGDWLEGRTLGKYKLVKRIGAGSFASIYEAVHVHLQVPFAIKILHPAFAGHDEIVKRFFREAQAASQLQHENVVFIADFDVAEGIGPYIVMEYLEGETLKAYLERNPTPPLEEVGEICRQICQALTLAHRKGIIHRDLKPENVFLIRRDMGHLLVKILDFGIAHLTAARDSITGAKLMGTPVYMAPEQFRGKVDSESLDIYSFGVILYEMLVGQPPFKGQSVQRLGIEHLLLPAPELDEGFPQALRQLQARLLGKTPEERPTSMEETWSLLADALDPHNQHPHWHQSNLLPNTIMPLPPSDTVIARVPGFGGARAERSAKRQQGVATTSIEPAPKPKEAEIALHFPPGSFTDDIDDLDAPSVTETTNVSMPPLALASADDEEVTVRYRVEPTSPGTSSDTSEAPHHKDTEAPTLQPTPGLEAPPTEPAGAETLSPESEQASSSPEFLGEDSPLQRVVLDESESSLAGSLHVSDLLEEEAIEIPEEIQLETHHVEESGTSQATDTTAPGTLSPPSINLIDGLDDADKTVPGRLSPPVLSPPPSPTTPAGEFSAQDLDTAPARDAAVDVSKLPPPPEISRTPEVPSAPPTQVEAPSGEKTAPHVPPATTPHLLQPSTEPATSSAVELPASNTDASVGTNAVLDESERTMPGTISPPQVSSGSRPSLRPPSTPPPAEAPVRTASSGPPPTAPNNPTAIPGRPRVTPPGTPPPASVSPRLPEQEQTTITTKVQHSRFQQIGQSLLRMSRREKRLLLIVWLGVLIALGSLYFLIKAEMPGAKLPPPPQRRAARNVNFRMSVLRSQPPQRRISRELQRVGIMSVPSGAVVYLNGELLGNTPLNIPLEVGQHIRLRFRKKGFEDGIITYQVQKLKTGSDSVLFHLRKAPKRLP